MPNTVTNLAVTNITAGVVTCTAHLLTLRQPFKFPTLVTITGSGLAANVTYYVKTITDANTFTYAATKRGDAVTTGTADSGTMTSLAMEKSVAPIDHLPGYAYASSTLSIPLAALTGLQASECNPNTGDIRGIIRRLLEVVAAAQTVLSATEENTSAMTQTFQQSGSVLSYGVRFSGTSVTVAMGTP